jgi:hypothetical protein
MLSEYKNILGAPRTGLHSYRILDTAMIDYVDTILMSFAMAYFTKVPLVLSTIIMFILGILVHLLFGLETNTVKYLRHYFQ